MAERTLVENVAQVKADFKAVKDAVGIVIPEGTPTSEYGERVFNTISSLENEIENSRTEGIEQVISNSRYIEKQASGKLVALNDVSEVYHDVVVKADTPTEVKVYGKNLFNIDDDTRFTKQDDGSYINNVEINPISIPLSLPYDTYTLSYDLSCPTGANARLSIGLKDGSRVEVYKGSDGSFIHTETTFTGEVVNWKLIYSVISSAETTIIKNLQLEAGYTASPYEPFQEQTITATPDGVEIPSNCPAMTFLADNDVTVDYFGSYGMEEEAVRWANAITCNGKRGNFNYGFANSDFSGRTIPQGLCKPKSSLAYTFHTYQGREMPRGIDCSEFSAPSANNQCYYTFYNASKLKKIYDMGIPQGQYYNTTFNYCSALEEIELIRCDENTVFNVNTFGNCTSLIRIGFTGTIASDINLQWCKKLDLESLVSLFSCLKNFKSDDPDNMYTKTITLSAESWALLDTYVYENGWNDYVDAKDVVAVVLGWNYA